MLEEGGGEMDGLEKSDAVVEDLFKQVSRLSIGVPPPGQQTFTEKDPSQLLVTSNPVFDIKRPSSKVCVVGFQEPCSLR